MKSVFLIIAVLSLFAGLYSISIGVQEPAENIIYGVTCLFFAAIFLRGHKQLKNGSELD